MIVLRICRRPSSARHVRELQDVLVTLAAFGMPLTLLFADEGVALLDARQGHDTELLAMLPGMGVERVLVEARVGTPPPLAPHDAVLPFEVVTRDQVRELLRDANHTVNL